MHNLCVCIYYRWLVCCALSCLSAVTYAEWFSDQQAIMGTDIKLTFWHDDANVAEQAIQDVMGEMRRIDAALSPYKETSELSIVNRLAAKKPVKISAELVRLIDKSLYFSKVSQGAFDITYASVGWKYDYRAKIKPSKGELASLLPAINYNLLTLNKKQSTIAFGHKNVRIDLGGLAKGYAVDRAVAILEKHGVTSASISAGGDSRIVGDRRGRPWVVGIKNPRAAKDAWESVIRLPLENVAVSTSGDYERYFLDEATGERIHHIINPKTGASAQEVVSVTILGPQGIDTDPMSTTVFVLGVKKGLALINQIPGFDCIIIDRKGKVFYSDELIPAK